MRRSRALLALATAARLPSTAPPRVTIPAPPRLSSAALRALLGAKDEVLAQMNARLADAAAHLVDVVREKDGRLVDAAARLAEVVRARDELLAVERKAYSREIALAKHAADVARGIVNARGLFESALAENVRDFESHGRGPAPRTVSAQLEWLLISGKCPELTVYLKAAAADNRMVEKHVLRQAGKLFDVLSERLHSGELGSAAAPLRMPAEVFERSGDPTRVTFAAFVAFAGRDLRLYDFAGGDVDVKLRVPAEVPGAALS